MNGLTIANKSSQQMGTALSKQYMHTFSNNSAQPESYYTWRETPCKWCTGSLQRSNSNMQWCVNKTPLHEVISKTSTETASHNVKWIRVNLPLNQTARILRGPKACVYRRRGKETNRANGWSRFGRESAWIWKMNSTTQCSLVRMPRCVNWIRDSE
jgi:hypothetical protein